MKRPELADEVTRKLELVTLSDPGSYSPKLADEVTREMKSQPGSNAKNIRSQVMRYEAWLSMQTRRSTLTSTLHEMNEYAESAGKTALVRNRKVHIFAPFRAEHSALWVVTRWQCVVLVALMLAWCGGLAFFPRQMLLATLTFITALYFGHFMMTLGLSCLTLQRSTEEEIDEQIVSALQTADWPYYTILCPLYKEARVVPQFVRAMQALDYPAEKLQILFLTEADDSETRNAIRALALPPHFKIVTVPDGTPRTKPRACNYGLMQATGQYIVIYDAEDIPEPTQLKKAVLTFANHGPRLACVQAKLNFYNPYQNLLTRWFTAEYSLWFDLILPGLQRAGLALPLGGTSNHFPTQILRTLGGWDAFNVAEDCDIGLRLRRYQLETVVLNSTTHEEANSRFKNWLLQRSRWIKGYMQTYLVNMRRPWRYLRTGGLRDFLSLQLVIGGKTAFLFLNPLLWLLFILYLGLNQFVAGTYHQLFPKPLLYAGTFTLVFGNFFYIYMYLLACFRRKQYPLMKWALLIPLYWIMMSMAACIALFQLIIKPHYWEKTEHGLHLGKKPGAGAPGLIEPHADPSVVDDEPTMPIARPGLPHEQQQEPVSSITAAFRAISTLPMPAFSREERIRFQKPQNKGIQDSWPLVTLIIACGASISACWYYFQQHEILLYGDAYSHLMLARRFFDSQSPGFAQLGGVWLPLPQVVMLPFIWNDTLWRTGLAGSIPSMLGYIIASVYIFLAARRLTHNNLASFVGTLVFVLNPNIMYLQSTPLSELVSIATCAMACYYFLAWAQDDKPQQLVCAAASIFLATLARYDGWALFVTMGVLIIVVGWIKHQRWTTIQGHVLVFGIFGSLGIILWFLWNQIIFHDFLYFQKGPYSAQGQALYIDTQQTYHNLWQAIRYYFFTSVETFGPILFILAAVALLIFVVRNRLTVETVAVMTFLVPFAFYVLTMYTGQAGIFVPGAVPANSPQQLFDVRFGSETVPAIAICLAILAHNLQQVFPRRWPLLGKAGHIWIALVVIVQSALIATGGIITVQDGMYGGSCAFPHPINTYLAQHYDGGRVLEDTFTSNIDGADAGLLLNNVVYDGSGKMWIKALQHPETVVDWIIMDPHNPNDIVAQHIDVNNPQFQQTFSLVYREDYGLSLYHRNGLPPLPTRLISPDLLQAHSLCKPGISPR
jgi:cellulose synthase/poly-beta-1,6-N-acetylglucosamine synthase-like glycosyltransferase